MNAWLVGFRNIERAILSKLLTCVVIGFLPTVYLACPCGLVSTKSLQVFLSGVVYLREPFSRCLFSGVSLSRTPACRAKVGRYSKVTEFSIRLYCFKAVIARPRIGMEPLFIWGDFFLNFFNPAIKETSHGFLTGLMHMISRYPEGLSNRVY